MDGAFGDTQQEVFEVRDQLRLQYFISAFDEMATKIHLNARDKGWWKEDRNDGEIIALIHSELSEALEGFRKGNPSDEHCPEFNSVEIELADAIIRIMDFAKAKGFRLAQAIVAKHNFNLNRPYKHGKRF